MPWNGSGTYALPPAYSPEVNGTTIDATRYNGLTNDVATGISAALAKNGENTATANLPMGGFKHTGAAAANASGQYLVYGQASPGEWNGTFPLGAVATPSVTFTGDTNTGMWSPGADILAWSIGGAEGMRLTSTGLGIGGTAGVKLDVVGQIRSKNASGDAGGLRMWSDVSGNGNIFEFFNAALIFGTNDTERARFDGSGQFGIGGTPAKALHLFNNGAPTFRIQNTGASGRAYDINALINGVGNAGFEIYDATAGASRIAIDSSGNVLINRTTSSGLGIFQVSGAATSVADFVSSGTGYVNIRAAAAGIAGVRIAGNGGTAGTNSLDIQQDSAGAVDIVQRTNARLSVYTNAAERLRINADGSMYGTALHNVGTPTGTATQYVASGTYTPTGFGVGAGNVAALTPNKAQWMRVGNVVTVSGMVQVDPTSANTNTFFSLSLPIASNFTGPSDLGGVANFKDVSDVNRSANVQADTVNDRVQFASTSTADTASNDWYYTYSYEVK